MLKHKVGDVILYLEKECRIEAICAQLKNDPLYYIVNMSNHDSLGWNMYACDYKIISGELKENERYNYCNDDNSFSVTPQNQEDLKIC